MKRIFLDTNFVIDYLLRTEYKPLYQDFLEKGTLSGCRFYVSALTIANFAYIARKFDKEQLYSNLKTIAQIFEVVDLTATDVEQAISMQANDFEDALQYQCAVSKGCSLIITRNVKDFQFSEIPVMSASEYMSRHGRKRHIERLGGSSLGVFPTKLSKKPGLLNPSPIKTQYFSKNRFLGEVKTEYFSQIAKFEKYHGATVQKPPILNSWKIDFRITDASGIWRH